MKAPMKKLHGFSLRNSGTHRNSWPTFTLLTRKSLAHLQNFDKVTHFHFKKENKFYITNNLFFKSLGLFTIFTSSGRSRNFINVHSLSIFFSSSNSYFLLLLGQIPP